MGVKYTWWIRLLTVLQILFSLMAIYALHVIGATVIFSPDKPTPTCPNGANPSVHMTLEIARQCAAERVELYVPQWVHAASRAAVPAYMLCFVCGLILKSILRKQGLYAKRWKTDLQIWTLSVTLVLHLLVFPLNWLWLFRYIIFGTRYAFP